MFANDDEIEYTAIKSSLNALLREDHADEVKEIIFDRAVRMTEIASLASLLFLFKANDAIDTQTKDFFLADGKKAIYDCFNAVTAENVENRQKMPEEFRMQMESTYDDQFEWPSRACLGNSYNYFRDQYITNLKTNLNVHCERRLTFFIRMMCFQMNNEYGEIVFDGTDIRNILKDAIKNQDWTDGDYAREWKRDALWGHLERVGFPRTCIKWFTCNKWFESMWPFLNIQREIENFLDRQDEPTEQRPPKISNFTVTPACNEHLKHIKIDMTVCYWLTSKLDALPKYKNPETGRLNNVPKEYYTCKTMTNEQKAERRAELFGILFDMEKIQRNGKNAKEFYGQIDSDGVSASVIYERQKRPIFFCLLMMWIKFIQGLFINVIGIDPGDKTWLAGVRRDIRSRVEVSRQNPF